MKNFLKFAAAGFSAVVAVSMTSCSDKDNDGPDFPDQPGEQYETVVIGFQNVPSQYFGGPTSYGANLYEGAEGQITTGYLAPVYGNTYAQFSINYGYNYNASFEQSWCYTFYNGGIALSNFHDMTDASYENQLSVYNESSPSGGNFVVANGYSTVSSPSEARYSDYEGCAKVYLTDAVGYTVANPGTETTVKGEDEEGWFKSVYINNTTYAFLTMRDGGAYASALNEENQGWFKVQFIAFDDPEENEAPLGYTEAYLANFNKNQAGGYEGIIDTWTKVDLSMLPECSVLVINFVGSDTGEWGLNTPAYCALDKFEITVEKD